MISDWLTIAINDPAGNIAEFWLASLGRRHSEQADKWDGLPDEYRTRFEDILSGASSAAELARVILASRMHFLFGLDPKWTRKSMLPLFDWSIDPRRAEQAWAGFTVWGRILEGLLSDLLPLYRGTFPHLSRFPERIRECFCGQLAAIAVYSPVNPLEEGWLNEFVSTVDVGSRVLWARELADVLRSMKEDPTKELWVRWLNGYWRKRSDGIPKPLEELEMKVMVEWLPDLEPVFPEAVERVCSSPAPNTEQTSLFHRLAEKETALRYPEAVSRLLLHLLRPFEGQFYHCSYLGKIVEGLTASSAPRSEIRDICSELARLGCDNASSLADLVKKSADNDTVSPQSPESD